MDLFEARIWERAEHWYFDVTIAAQNETLAWSMLRKDYPKRDYAIRSVRRICSR